MVFGVQKNRSHLQKLKAMVRRAWLCRCPKSFPPCFFGRDTLLYFALHPIQVLSISDGQRSTTTSIHPSSFALIDGLAFDFLLTKAFCSREAFGTSRTLHKNGVEDTTVPTPSRAESNILGL